MVNWFLKLVAPWAWAAGYKAGYRRAGSDCIPMIAAQTLREFARTYPSLDEFSVQVGNRWVNLPDFLRMNADQIEKDAR